MLRISAGLLGAALSLVASPLQAQPVEPFTSKNVQLLIGFGTGGGYDVYARQLARHSRQ